MPSPGDALERYAFSFVAKYIHLADSEEQSQLIELVGQLHTAIQVSNGSSQSDHGLARQLPGSCLNELKQEWEKALNKSDY